MGSAPQVLITKQISHDKAFLFLIHFKNKEGFSLRDSHFEGEHCHVLLFSFPGIILTILKSQARLKLIELSIYEFITIEMNQMLHLLFNV